MTTAAWSQYSLDDTQIRSALLRTLGNARYAQSTVIQELGMLHGASRVDVAVLGRDLHGYEIKSDKDTLNRFVAQIDTYSQVMNRVTVVAGWRWVVPVMKLIPPWWGAMLAERTRGGTVRVVKLREPERNPAPDLLAIARLLWRGEALRLLEERQLDRGVRSKPRAIVYRRLVDAFPDADTFGQVVRDVIRSREGWRVGGP